MRMIDADKFKEDLLKLWDYSSVDGITATTVLKQVISDLDNAPTVSEITKEKLSNAYDQGYEDGKNNWLQEARPQGEWIEENSETGALGIKYTWFRCNQCGWENGLVIPRNFCPNCGADMRGVE